MSPQKDFNKKAGLSDQEIIARLVANNNLVDSMDAAAKALYIQIAGTGVFDRNTATQTFTIPAGADPKALKAALQAIDVSSDPAVKIVLVQEMARDADIVETLKKQNRKNSAKPKKPTA